MPLLASLSLPLGAKGSLNSSCEHSIMLFGSEIWPFKDEGVVKLGWNDARVVRWIYKFRTEDRFPQRNLGLD